MKALVVDDVLSNRLTLKGLLEDNGFITYVAENGLKGVELFKSINPDIVLMDIMMPVMDGYEATRLIKDYAGEHFVPVIVLTVLNEPEDMAQAIDCGADDFISKPVHGLILKSKLIAMERLRQLYHNQNIQNLKLKAAIEEIERAKQQLEIYSGDLEVFNSKMRQEHDAASNLFQKVIQLNEQKCVNVQHIILPLETFSGDIVLSRAKPSGGFYILLGDFAGHGLLAAIGAIPVSELFNSMADRDEPISNFIPEINIKLKQLLPASVFLCACIVELSFDQQSISVWNGGVPGVLIVGKNGCIKHKITSSNLPLGILPNDRISCNLESVSFDPEDHIYMFSDGVTEVFNSDNEMYGQERLENNFYRDGQCDSEYSPDRILDKIRNNINAFGGKIGQRDDVTMVQVKCSPECQI